MATRRYSGLFPEVKDDRRRRHRLLLRRYRRLGDRGDEDAAAAHTRVSAAFLRENKTGRHHDHGRRADPDRTAGGRSTGSRSLRPCRNRARSAARPELAPARGPGARRRPGVRALAGSVRLVAYAARGLAEKAGTAEVAATSA